MSWTYNEAAELLGETGQTVAGNLIAYDGTHLLVGTTSETGVFSLTNAGHALLEKLRAERVQAVVVQAVAAQATEPEVKPRGKKKVEPESEKVEVAPESVSELDLDL